MTDIYYGRIPHSWALEIENWKIDANQELKDYEIAKKQMELSA